MPRRRHLTAIVAALALASAAPALADLPVPAGIADVMGARGLSLGAYRGVAGGNDAIYTNAASLAARRRYSMEATWLLDRYGDTDVLQLFNASVVDSQTTSVTGGIAYTWVVSGPWQGNLFHVPIAFSVGQGAFLAATPKWQSLNGPDAQEMRAFNFDASLFWQMTSSLAVGFAGYNLIYTGHKYIQPRGMGGGISYGDDRRFHVAGDWRGDFDRQGKMTSLFAVGGEVLVGDWVPVRASYVNDATRKASFWSAGIGVVSSAGIAVDLAYRQSFETPTERTFAAAIKIFLSSQ